jgi:hypothetical protein
MTCVDEKGRKISSKVALNIVPYPNVEFSVKGARKDGTWQRGSTARLVWKTYAADSCSLSPLAVTGTSGAYETDALNEDVTLTLSCRNISGTVQRSVKIQLDSEDSYALK